MIIDIHTHIFPERIAGPTLKKLSLDGHILPFTDGTKNGLLRSMREAGVDRSVVLPVATSPGQVIKVNDNALRINEEEMKRISSGFSDEGETEKVSSGFFAEGETEKVSPGFACGENPGVISFGCIHPDFEDYAEELRRLKGHGVKGIKIHPVYQMTDIDDVKFLRILYEAASLGLAVITHGGLDIGFPGVVHCSPAMCRHVVDEIGSFDFIAAHMGGWNEWDDALEELAGTGIYLDTAFAVGRAVPTEGSRPPAMLDEEMFLKMVRSFGPDHILFGSDNPWSSQKESLEALRSMQLSEEEKRRIEGENAAALLRHRF